MTVEQIYLTKEELFKFIEELKLHRGHDGSQLSLSDFIKHERKLTDTDKTVYQANIGKVVLEEGELADLRGADLSFVRFCDKGESKTYNGQWNFYGFYSKSGKLLSSTNLQGAVFPEKCLLDGISFHGADLGKIAITSDQFKRCSFKGALFDPSNPQIMIVKVGERELKAYIKLRHKHPVHMSAIGSFSDYISYTKRHLCSDGIKIVADLSGQIIDGTKINLDGADFSGSLLENTIFKNIECESLIMRDCGVAQAKFDNCKINRVDFRGTKTQTGLGFNSLSSIKFTGGTKLGEVKLSTLDYNSPFATPIVDSCYIKGSSSIKIVGDRIVTHVPDLGKYRKCTIEDIQEYAKQCQESEQVLSSVGFLSNLVKEQLQSFKEFLSVKYGLEGDFIPDASGLVLDKLNLSYGNWGKCNWSRCSMVETNWDHSNLSYSCFNDSSFDGYTPGFGMSIFERAYHTSFKGAILTGSNFDGVRSRAAIFTGAIMNLVSAIGANFVEARFDKVQARNSDFSYSHLELVKAREMDASNSIMRDVFFIYGDAPAAKFNHSTLDGAVFNYANLRRAELKYVSAVGACFKHVDARDANLTGSKLWANVSRMNLGGARLDHVENSGWEVEPGILNGLFGDSDPYIDENTKADRMIGGDKALGVQEKVAYAKQDAKAIGNSKWRWALYAAAGALDMGLGGRFFRNMALAVCDLANHKLLVAGCAVAVPLALTLIAKTAMTHIAGATLATLFMTASIVPIVAVGAVAGVAAAAWYIGAGTDSKEVRDVQARKVEFKELHPENAHLHAPKIVKRAAKEVSASPVLKMVGGFVSRLGGKKSTHRSHVERISGEKSNPPSPKLGG